MSLHEVVHLALREDMPNGDLTTESLALSERIGVARLQAKGDLVLSGISPFEGTMLSLEPNAKLTWHFSEGDAVLNGQFICTIFGNLIPVLKAERVALNFISHLSGIATLTRKYVDQVAGTEAKILDTRKTLPTLRELERKAVVHGKGFNHRQNLSEAILIKENHIRVAGGLTAAVNRIRHHSPNKPITIEVSDLEEVKEAVGLNVDRILLDNFTNDLIREAVPLIPRPIEIEASGNMTVERVRQVAILGVHYISVGALTHSAPSADLSLLFDWGSSKGGGQ